MTMAGTDAPPLGSTWSDVDAEGSQFLTHGKKHIAFATFNKAAETPGGCGWRVFAHRGDCKLRLLDFAGALEDAVRAVDMYSQEQRELQTPMPPPAAIHMTAADALWREAELEDALVLASRLRARRKYLTDGSLIGDEQGQRVEGLKADIRHALDQRVTRVLRRDLIRAMLRHKGINPKRLTAGQRLSWVTISSIQADAPPQAEEVGVKTPLPLPIVWGASPLLGQASDSEDSDEEGEGAGEEEEGQKEDDGALDGAAAEGGSGATTKEGVQVKQDAEPKEDEKEDGPAEDGPAEDGPAEDEPVEDGPAEDEPPSGEAAEPSAAPLAPVTQEKKGVAQGGPGGPDGPRWGWLKQVPGHDHICADPLVAAQADRIAELRTLGRLENDRAYIHKLLGLLHSVQERPGEQRTEAGCPPCPGPNLSKWRDDVLRADKLDEKQDPLAPSKWAAQDLCRKTLGEVNHMVHAELRCKPRYLHPTAARGPSPHMRAARAASRRERAFSTVRFMLRRVHDSLRHGLNRDVEQVGERLTMYLEKLPCRIFVDRLEALARTLDCRAVAARRRNNSKLAIAMQKRRCALAADHGLSALYIRALDEVALVLFSIADYPMAETSWNERLTRLHQRQRVLQEDVVDGELSGDELRRLREERAQVVFQLARCCFVQGYLRMAGPKANKQAAKKDHRRNLPEFSLGVRHTSSDLFKHPMPRRSTSVAESDDVADDEEGGDDGDDKLYQCEWSGDCQWSPSLLGYDLGEGLDEEVIDYCPVEIKPSSVEACLKIIMDELGTEDPLNEYGHLLVMERYPDPEDASRTYPLMPADFDPENNIMDAQYEMFERRFLDACHYFVADITGVAFEPEAPTTDKPGPGIAPPSSPTEAEAEAGATPEAPEPKRLPSVTEEPEVHDEEQPPGGA